MQVIQVIAVPAVASPQSKFVFSNQAMVAAAGYKVLLSKNMSQAVMVKNEKEFMSAN